MAFVKSPYFQSRQGQKIVGIVLHTMVGTYKGTISYFQNNASQVSAHYCIDLNGDITQMVDEEKAANHAGIVSVPTYKQVLERPGINPNWFTLGIEHADNKDPAGADRKNQYPTSIQLVADLCTKYSIPCDREHICGHHEIRSTKTCPGNLSVNEIIFGAQKILNPQPSSDVPPDLLQWGKNSLKDLNEYIVFLRENSTALADLTIVADERKSLIEWIATKLGCSSESGVIKSEIEKLMTVEDLSEEAQKNLKKTIEEKDLEIVRLNNDLKSLQEKLNQMEEDHQKQIQTMREQLNQAITQKTQAETHKKQLNFVQHILQGFINLGRKK